jgi:hypothetical protein
MAVPWAPLPFKVELTDKPQLVTAFAALPLNIEMLRATINRERYRELARALGYKKHQTVRRHVESCVLLIAAGGDHIDDLKQLRDDPGLPKMIGFTISSPTQVKDFLYRFHQSEEGRPLTDADDDRLSVKGTAQIRPEGPGLRALADIIGDVVGGLQRLRPRTTATLDIDATIIAAHKARALRAYEGTIGYQPQMAWWAEHGVWLCDEFRDGNVPAAFGIRAFLKRAFGALPAGVDKRRLRADSALYDEKGLTWADDNGIEFAVSAVMSKELSGYISQIPESSWQPYKSHSPQSSETEERQWAEVVGFIPSWGRNYRRDSKPLRYVAIRVRSVAVEGTQEEPEWRHFCVVTNMTWNGDRLLRWHREKQGTVEYGHGVLKNDLGGGVLPCGRFGSNAAWWRLNVLVANLLELVKVTALPAKMSSSRPKALRFWLFCLPGRLVRRSRSWVLRVFSGFSLSSALTAGRRRIESLAQMLHCERVGAS